MTTSHGDIDYLKLYFCEPFSVKCGEKYLEIYQPTIGDIMRIGESEVYSTAYIFIGNTTTYRVQLWDLGIDWNKITDFDLFYLLIKGIKTEYDEEGNLIWNSAGFLFGNQCDFSKFERYEMNKDGETSLVLYDEHSGLLIDEDAYKKIVNYIRAMFGINPKVEKAKGKITKETIITQEKSYMNLDKNKTGSMLLNLISFCVNHPGFKYKKTELKDVGIFEFMDSVRRLQVYESTGALLKGAYSGFCDTSKIDKINFDFMRDVYNETS